MIVRVQGTAEMRATADILRVYHSEMFTNVKNNVLRTIDLLYTLGYYDSSESLFDKENS